MFDKTFTDRTFTVEQTNNNLTLKTNLLWTVKLYFWTQLSLMSLVAAVIFIFSQSNNTLECDRSTDKCILNISLLSDSSPIKIPVTNIQAAEIKQSGNGNKVLHIDQDGRKGAYRFGLFYGAGVLTIPLIASFLFKDTFLLKDTAFYLS